MGRTLLGVLLFASPPFAAFAASSTFADPQIISTSPRASNLAMGDFDGDGNPDVAVMDQQTGAVEVHFGNGSGGFRSPVASFTVTTSDNSHRGITAADLDGDDHWELVFAAGNEVKIYDWDGTQFSQANPISLSTTGIDATKVSVGDLTAAGSRDIVVSDDYGSVGVVWIPNDGTGNYGSPTAFAAAGCDQYAVPVLADVNGDGFDDVILSHETIVNNAVVGSVGVLVSKRDGTLGTEVTYLNSSYPTLQTHGVAFADVNGDGKPDLVTVADVGDQAPPYNVTFYLNVNLNNGDGTFANGVAFRFMRNNGANIIAAPVIGAVDLNGDGRADIVTLTNDGAFLVTQFAGTGSGFAPASEDAFPTQSIAYSSITFGYTKNDGTFATFNNDPQPDLIIGTNYQFGATPPLTSQFLVLQNTTPPVPTPLEPPTLTINGSATPSAIVAGASLAFGSTETSNPVGVCVSVQFSTTPADEGSWVDLPTGNNGRMIRTSGTGTDYTLTTAAYPNGSGIYFRAIAKAPGYLPNTSPNVGPFTLEAALSISISAVTTSDPVDGRVVQAGDAITYTLHVANAMTAPRAEHLQITDLLPVYTMKNGQPGQLTVRATDVTEGGILTFARDLHGHPMRAILWRDVGGLDPGQSLDVSFSVALSTKINRKLVNVARLNSSIFNSVYSVKSTNGKPLAPADGNTAPSRIPVQPPAGVFFTITSKSDPAAGEIGLGANILYTLTYENSGSEDAQNVIVSADVPKGATFVDGDGGFNFTGKGVNWVVGTVPAFTSGTKTYRVMVNPDATPNSKLTGGCTVTCKQKASDTDTLPSYTIVTPVKITLTAAPASNPTGTDTHVGDTITYTLAYENVTGGTVKGVTLSCGIPAKTTLALDSQGNPDDSNASQKGSTLSWPLADLAVGEHGARTFRVTVGNKLGIGDDVSGNITLVGKDIRKFTFPLPNVTVRNPLHIVLTPALVPNPLHPGDGMILQFTCTNASSFTLENVKISELLPTGTHFQSATDGGAFDDNSGQLVWTFPSLKQGEQRIVSFYATVDYDVDLGAILYNGNLDVGDSSAKGIQIAIDRNGFSATSDDPITNKANGLVATGDTPIGFQISSVPPATRPILALSQTAEADGNLRRDNPAAQLLPVDLGDVATVVMPPSPSDGLNGQITYHFEYKNTGSETARNLHLDIFVPSGTSLAHLYYSGPDLQHQNPVSESEIAIVRNILTWTIGDLAPGASQIFSFKANVDPSRKSGFIDINGASLSSDSFFKATQASPDTLTTAIVPPVTFQCDCVADRAVVQKSGDQNNPATVKYTITYRNNGGVPASNVSVVCPLSKGATFRSSTFQGGTDATSKPETVTFSDATPLLPNTPRTFELVTNVENAPDNSQLVLQPQVSGRYVRPGASGITRASAPSSVLANIAVSSAEVTRLLPPLAARLVIGRRQIASVHPGEYIVYEFIFGNSGNQDATNVKIGALIPDGTTLAKDLTDQNAVTADPVWNGRLITPASGSASALPKNHTVKNSIVTWTIGTLPAHAGGVVRMVVRVNDNFTECAIQDNSCYISADNAPSCVPGPVSTGVLLKNVSFFGGLWRTIGCFFEGVGARISGILHNQPATNQFSSLVEGTYFTTVGGADMIVTHSFGGAEGAYTIPLGGNQVLVIEGGRIVSEGGAGVIAAGSGNVISHDGGTLINHDGASVFGNESTGVIAAGGGNLITLNGIDGSNGGNLLASDLLSNCDHVIAAGGGNILVARGGNLLTTDGASLINHDGASLVDNAGNGVVSRGGSPVVVNLNAAGVIAAGGGNVIAAGGGNIVSNDGGSLLGRAFGFIFSLGGSNGVIAAGAGNLIGHDGGSLIGHDGGSLIGHDGGSLLNRDVHQ